MLKIVAVISILAALADAIYVGEEQVFVQADKVRLAHTTKFNPKMTYCESNSPSMRGVMSFTNLELRGSDLIDMDAKFDPIDQVIHMEMVGINTELIGNYTARLHLRKNNTIVEGAGLFRMAAPRYHMSDIRFPVRYRPAAGKFQLDYPTQFEPKDLNLDFEMTGLKNADTGEAVSGIELYKLTEGYEKPGFMSIWPTIVNFNMQSGYAKRLGDALVHSFFDALD